MYNKKASDAHHFIKWGRYCHLSVIKCMKHSNEWYCWPDDMHQRRICTCGLPWFQRICDHVWVCSPSSLALACRSHWPQYPYMAKCAPVYCAMHLYTSEILYGYKRRQLCEIQFAWSLNSMWHNRWGMHISLNWPILKRCHAVFDWKIAPAQGSGQSLDR